MKRKEEVQILTDEVSKSFVPLTHQQLQELMKCIERGLKKIRKQKHAERTNK